MSRTPSTSQDSAAAPDASGPEPKSSKTPEAVFSDARNSARSQPSMSTGYLRHDVEAADCSGSPSSSPPPSQRSHAGSEVFNTHSDPRKSKLTTVLRAATPNATLLRRRRDDILNDPDFEWKTFDSADGYYFDDPYRSLEWPDSIHTLECWDYEDCDGVDRNQFVRYLEAGSQGQFGADNSADPALFNEKFEQWLKQEGNFVPLSPHVAGKLRGGLRLAMCDRPLMNLGMTIRKDMFESIEKQFRLHDATLLAFTDNGGCFTMYAQRDDVGGLQSLQVVIKAQQKVEITNCLLSFNYEVSSQWTDALMCGDSLILAQESDDVYGNQEEQLLDSIACGGKHLWTNPLLLPVALLQMCTRRTLTRARVMEKRLISVERALGVVNAGWVVVRKERPNWPLDIDIKRQTTELHSALPKIIFLRSVILWQKRYAAWLLDTARTLQSDPALAVQRASFEELISTIQLHVSSIDGSLEFIEGMEGRTQSQINMLFSVVGQIDGINSQKANTLNLEVARSTKEDSISMSTFTLVTVLYLPGSFIATMFSMGGMFEWGEGASDEARTSVVSKRYWIFWCTVLPLTLLTLSGWYFWYRHASRKWNRKLAESNAGSPGASDGAEISGRGRSDSADEHMRQQKSQFREKRKEEDAMAAKNAKWYRQLPWFKRIEFGNRKPSVDKGSV